MSYIPYSNPYIDFNAGLFVQAKLFNYFNQQEIEIPFKIDSGSSRTVIPIHIINLYLNHLKPIYETSCTGFEGTTLFLPIYVIQLTINPITFQDIEVIGVHRNNQYGLLGRDLLKRFFLRCDGPKEQFEIEYIS